MSFVQLLKAEPRPVAFGLLLTFSSSVGQTYLIAIFVPAISTSFALSASDVANIYAVITIASAATLTVVGRYIDRVDLVLYTAAAVLSLALGCGVLALAEALPALIFGLFVIRLGGQGLLSHVALTAVARYFERNRGRALALTSLGYPLGEAILPTAMLVLIGLVGWRLSYAAWALALALVVAPLSIWLVHRHGSFRRPSGPSDATKAAPPRPSLGTLLRSRYFMLLLPSVCAGSIFSTALIFHQAWIAGAKGIDVAWFAASFTVFAGAQVASSIMSGPLVDRFGARCLYPFHLLPAASGVLLLASIDDPWVVPAYLGLLGATSGIAQTTRSAIVAELVAANQIGAARSVFAALMVVASAIGPAIFGWLIAAETGVTSILAISIVAMATASALAFIAETSRLPRPSLPD